MRRKWMTGRSIYTLFIAVGCFSYSCKKDVNLSEATMSNESATIAALSQNTNCTFNNTSTAGEVEINWGGINSLSVDLALQDLSDNSGMATGSNQILDGFRLNNSPESSADNTYTSSIVDGEIVLGTPEFEMPTGNMFSTAMARNINTSIVNTMFTSSNQFTVDDISGMLVTLNGSEVNLKTEEYIDVAVTTAKEVWNYQQCVLESSGLLTPTQVQDIEMRLQTLSVLEELSTKFE